jgi:hypothetical protein
MDIIRERVASFLDETVLLPSEDFLNEIVKAYPETTRTAYRYGKVPISKVLYFASLNERRGLITAICFDSNIDSLLLEKD